MSEAAKQYVERAIAGFDRDPPSTDYQRGFLAALETVRGEAFEPASRKRRKGT